MAEKIKVAELTINTAQLVKEMQSTKDEIDKLKASQKQLKDAGKENSAQFIENAAAIKSTSATYRAQEKTLRQVTGATKELSDELGKEAKSLGEAADQNKKLRQYRENLNLTTKEGQDALEKINKKLDQNTDFMKENQDAQIQNKMNVGNYKDSILEALGIQQAYNTAIETGSALQGAYAFVVGKSTGAMKLFKIALASTGIGLLVIALGSLISYFTQTQEGINKVNNVLTPLKEVFGELQGAVQEFGAALAKLFSGGGFKAFFKDVSNAGEKVKESFDTAWKRGKEIEKLKQNLSRTEADYITKQAQLRKEFEEQNKLADDQTKSAKEREAAAQRAIEAQGEISQLNIERIKQEAEILRLKQQANDTSDEERAELATKLAEIDKALQEEASKTKEAQNKLNSIRKQANAEAAAERKANYEAAKERREQEIQDTATQLEQELALYEAKAAGVKRTGEEELQYIKDRNKEELEILQFKRDKDLISELEYQTAKTQLRNQEKAKEAEIAQAELDAVEAFNEKKAALEEEIYLKSLENDEQRELAKLDRKFEKEEAEIEAMKVSAERKAELMLLLEEQYQQDLTEAQGKWAEKRAQEEQQREKAALKAKKELAQARWDIASGLSQLLNNLAGEDAKVQKAALIFEKGLAASRVIVNTATGVSKAVAASPLTGGLPWSGIIAAQGAVQLANIAATTISGMKQINESANKKEAPKSRYAQGGNIWGAPHSTGGVELEAEGGESIINKRSTFKYAGLLSAINEAEGGRPILGGNQSTGLIDYDLLAAKMAQANMSLPAPRVGVDEISSVSSRAVEIAERARF